jgi:hypothetical protein
VILIDLGILLSAYTSLSVYALVPVVYLPYIAALVRRQLSWRQLWHDVSFLSAIGLGLLLSIQPIIMLGWGTATVSGYAESPFDITKSIEIIIARSFYYPLIHSFYHHFTDWLTVLLLAVTAFGIWRYALKSHQWLYLFGMYSIVITTLLLIINRSGIHTFFNHYTSGGPSHFFFAQNLIAVFLLVLFLQDSADIIKNKLYTLLSFGVLGFLFLWGLPEAGVWGKDTTMAQEVGTFKANAEVACRTSSPDQRELTVRLYPNAPLILWKVPINILCADFKHEQL